MVGASSVDWNVYLSMKVLTSWHWLHLLAIWMVAAEQPNMTFHLGILGPVTSYSQSILAAAVAFDIDFRKNFEPELVSAFGEPIINIPNLHPDLRIQPVIGTSDSTPEIAARTALEWAAGLEPFPQVSGIVEGMESSISEQVATISNGFRVPQVSWGAASHVLSDDLQYPYVSRAMPPDHMQGAAAWAWMQHFSIPAVAVCYSDDAYGEALFQSVIDAAGAVGDLCKTEVVGQAIHRIAFPSMPDASAFRLDVTQLELRSAKATGSRFIMLFMRAPQRKFTLHVMETEHMLYGGTHQIFASQESASALMASSQDEFSPSLGLPVGFQMLVPVMKGRLFADFENLWMKLSPSDVYNPQARQLYMIDDMVVPLTNASAPVLTEGDFANNSAIDPMVPFLFDAAYTFVFAINAVLRQGMTSGSVGGKRLATEIRKVEFEGITGNVSYSHVGDRAGFQELWNVKIANSGSASQLEVIGRYNPSSKDFSMALHPTWAGGEENMTVPASLLSCAPGFEHSPLSKQCYACLPGVGCGFRSDQGFPIGIYAPITSISHEFMAMAVLFDLDFRKHSDPALRLRFGEPLIEIPNMHPDLKIKLQLGSSDSRVSIAMQTVLDWFQGIDGAYKVAGIVGGYFSAVSAPVASIAEVFQIPQISFGSTSAALSDKSIYPWFSRTITFMSANAMWAWMEHFKVPSMVVVYTRDLYGEPLFQSIADISIKVGEAQRIVGIGVSWMSQAHYDHSIMRETVASVDSTGRKFVFFCGDSGLATAFMHAMEEKGMLYSTHQLVCSYFSSFSGGYIPSRGLPNGFMKFEAAFEGQSFPKFMNMWHSMTPDDIYGREQTDRYMLNNFKVLLPEGSAGRMTREDFLTEPIPTSPFMVDAAYAFVIAINNLLNAGVAPQDIHGSRLLEAVRAVSFEGVTGTVSFDANGDRQGNQDFFNVISGDGSSYERIGTWSVNTRGFSFQGDGNVTWVGGLKGTTVPDQLTACVAGTRWDEEAGHCISCPSNFFSIGGSHDRARCKPCPPGQVGNAASGATGCVACPVGTWRSTHEGNCTLCDLGTYADSQGSSSCTMCEVGKYATSEGLTACESCDASADPASLFTTMEPFEKPDGTIDYGYVRGASSASACACDRGAREDGAGGCISCTTGMICRGMNEVVIKEGYYAQAVSLTGELSVFQCFGDIDRCQGGPPGSTCASGRKQTSITCAECLEGKTPSQGGSCKSCGDSDIAPVLIAGGVLIALLVATYHFLSTVNRATQSHSLLLCAIAVGLLMTVTQQLGVIGMLTARYEEPLDALLHTFGVLALDIEVLRFTCITSTGSLGVYLLKISQIIIYVVVILITHVFFVVCRHRRKFREQKHALIGAIGTVFMVFYITVTSTVLQPLQCQEHPNGKWTVRAYPSVICWEDHDHIAMLIVGVIAFVAVPLSFIVACVVVVVQLPTKMHHGDSQFLKAYAFLFLRFRPSQHGYIIVTMLRSLAFAMVLVLPDVAVQMFFLQVVLLFAVMATLHRMPWRLWLANILDCVSSAIVLLVVCLCSFFVADEDKDPHAIAAFAFVGVIIVLVIAPCVVVLGLYRKYFRLRKSYDFFLCHHKASAGAYARLLKTHLLEHPKLKAGVFVDADNLDNLDYLFNYVGNDTNRLVIICTAEIFTRPWCVGEMCTAELKNVPTAMVMMPEAELPDQEFIADIENHLGSQGVELLIENGITIEIISTSLQVIAKKADRMEVPGCASQAVMQAIADQLIMSSWSAVVEYHTETNKENMSQCLTIFDWNNLEAAATAYLLLKLTTPVLTHVADRLPVPWQSQTMSHSSIDSSVSVIVVVCTNGVFEQEDVLQVIQHMPQVAATFMPVICESGFRIPHKDLPALLRNPPSWISTVAIPSLAHSVQHIFKEIAITFDAQHMGDAALHLAAAEVAKRLLNPARRSKRKCSGSASLQISNRTSTFTTLTDRSSQGREKRLVDRHVEASLRSCDIDSCPESPDTRLHIADVSNDLEMLVIEATRSEWNFKCAL